ncbi:MAG: class I SAM-dependent methyltransferase [Actinobacteria bacterium]|nr:class I SAM-dependent methyltransferase [Actinomycetota bacterium]
MTAAVAPEVLRRVLDLLEEAQRQGLTGPGPVGPQVFHTLAMARAVGDPPSGRALDLGTGAGVPGLVLALAWPESRWTLLDSRQRSAGFVRMAAEQMGLSPRVGVVCERAEDAGRDPDHRGGYELVTARGFGPPAITAECAAPLLAVGGRLVVSEPPDPSVDRWPPDALEPLGLQPEGRTASEGASFMLLRQVTACPDRFPRRRGVPRKRPLFPNPAVDVSRETNPVLDSQGRPEDNRSQ